jgi:hypothetical protein
MFGLVKMAKDAQRWKEEQERNKPAWERALEQFKPKSE